jgi:hypothetical protein
MILVPYICTEKCGGAYPAGDAPRQHQAETTGGRWDPAAPAQKARRAGEFPSLPPHCGSASEIAQME